MKELTIEEKARRYDEKLDVAKHIYADPSVKDEDKYYIEVIFPELKESEDERIRKELIKIVNDHYSLFKEIDRAKTIAWLEKQSEQKSADKIEPKFNVGDTVTVKPMSSHGKVFKGEPFKIVDIIEDNYVSDDGKTYSISLQDGWELVQQNPAWSEEDENNILFLTSIIEECFKNKEKITLCGDTVCANFTKEDVINRLKSLKDRVQTKNTWKPNEEQLKSLKNVIDVGYFTSYPNSLETLYEQLKQL